MHRAGSLANAHPPSSVDAAIQIAPLAIPAAALLRLGMSATLTTSRLALTRYQLARLLWCGPFVVMLTLLVVEAMLSAATTWLVIQAGRDVINDEFLVKDLGLILACQVSSYIVGAVSWVFAEQAVSAHLVATCIASRSSTKGALCCSATRMRVQLQSHF